MRWFSKNSAPADAHLEGVAVLLRAAEDDPAFARQVHALLRLPSMQRTSIVNTALHEMALRGEARDVRVAFGVLATDEGAALALRYFCLEDSA